MKIRLGYVALPIELNITASSLMTYTHYQTLDQKQAFIKLDKIIKSNFEALKEILYFNIRNEIYFYRMTSSLIPLGTHNKVDYEIFEKYKNEFKEIGDIIKDNGLRVDIHPDQFCVLNSAREEVVESSINMLTFYKNIIKAMRIDSYLILHIGGKTNGKKAAIDRFINTFNILDEELKKIIIIENDDKVFNIRNTLKVCEKLEIPMVLDYHHFICNRNNEKIEDYIERIFKTWNRQQQVPKIHFSTSKSKSEKRAHHDYINSDDFINFIEKVKFTNQDFDVMIEAKMKTEAMFRLIREIKYKKEYHFIKTTCFLV